MIMRIDSVRTKIAFKRNLMPEEVDDYVETLRKAKQLSGQTGHSVLIMPTSSLPQTKEFNSGVGHLSSDIAQDFLKYMKIYLGINVVEDLPAGQVHANNGFYCAYKGSALSLGNHQVNPELLISKDFGEILTKEDVKRISDANTAATKDTVVNFANVMDNSGEQNKVLKKAFENFKKLDENHPLKAKFSDFVKENSDWLNIPHADEPNADFFKFKQFLAEEHLKIGKTRLNQNGMKLCGDMLVGFSKEEQKAFPKAFVPNQSVGTKEWKAPCLNFDEIFDPQSDAYKLLKRKVQLNARRYDMLRIDAAWTYVAPKIKTDSGRYKRELGSKLLEQIEGWVKEVKGKDFDLSNIIYEFAADDCDFEAFKDGKLIEPLKNRIKVYSSQYMHAEPDTWGYTKAFLDKKWSPDEFMLGVGNHDNQPLRQIANGVPDEIKPGVFVEYKNKSILALSKALGIPASELKDPTKFANSKWADTMMARNNMAFFADVFGKEDRFDTQWKKETVGPKLDYAMKVSSNYQQEFQEGIQSGFGLNSMAAEQKVFEKKGLDVAFPALYKKIIHYKNVINAAVADASADLPENISTLKKFKPFIFAAVGVLAVLSGIKYLSKKQPQQPEKPLNIIARK